MAVTDRHVVGYGVISLNRFMVSGGTHLPDFRPDILFILINRLGAVISCCLVDALAQVNALIQLARIGQRVNGTGV